VTANSSPCRITHIGGRSTFSPGGLSGAGQLSGEAGESFAAYLEQLAEAGHSVTGRICAASCQLEREHRFDCECVDNIN
jgi:hypothetical protein